MKQIVVISGKGGTGKTVVTASLAALADHAVMADCDVDAADLHLLLEPDVQSAGEFRSGATAVIDQEKCVQCGQCRAVCRFDAISTDLVVDPVGCEGCAFCHYVCPAGAITMQENHSGAWYISQTRFGTMVHAKLGVAEENSGKLVSLVREKAKALAQEQGSDWIIIDGSPGIGCPVIASLSGADCALVVTEPTLSGMHDALRVMDVAKHFGILSKVVINKYDLNPDVTDKIIRACQDNGAEVIGHVPFDKTVVKAMVEGKTIIEGGSGPAEQGIRRVWERIKPGQGL
ncbi:MAG: ATP-binding protein [Candidatus Omnitrophota bacterium]